MHDEACWFLHGRSAYGWGYRIIPSRSGQRRADNTLHPRKGLLEPTIPDRGRRFRLKSEPRFVCLAPEIAFFACQTAFADPVTSDYPVHTNAKVKRGFPQEIPRKPESVSYTHLTLPTIYSV